MRSRFFILIFFFFSFDSYAQSDGMYYSVITVKDTPVNSGRGGTMEPLRIVSINKEEKSQVVSYSFDMRHQMLDLFYNKRISSDSLQHFQEKYLLDTFSLNKWEKENELLVYMQLLKGKWKIIFDVNHSGGFTDDKVYYKDTVFFANRNTFAIPHIIKFWYQKPYTKELTFHITPDGQLPRKFPDALYNTWGGARKIVQGRLYVGLDSFLIKIFLLDKHLHYSKYGCNFSVSNANENDFQLFETGYPMYSQKDSLYVGNQILMLDSVSIMGDTIVFRKVGENEALKGVQPGAILRSISGTHLYSGLFEDFKLKRNDGKYTLLHFWGSWCGPCIANLPKLKSFVENYGKKVEIIGFPFEQQKDTLKTKKLIQEYKLNWKQIIQLKDHPFQKPDVVKQMAIEHFPTYMLIDVTGKIIVRSSNLEDVIEKLQ